MMKQNLDETEEVLKESESFWSRLKWRFWNGGIKLWWYRLWIRKDEFDDSLDTDLRALINMTPKQKERYMADLMRRREIAHQREMAETDKKHRDLLDKKSAAEKSEQ